jgi:hypothetical protein
VVNGNESGPGSYRQAVADASANSSIRQVVFAPNLSVDLQSSVVYSGTQDLVILGRGSTISGASAAKAATWDGGLFVSMSDADITLRNLDFVESFNNGIAVFIPASATGNVAVTLDRVSIDASTYHGLFVDGQAFSGFNTDDVPHPACVDPHFFDSAAGVVLNVLFSSVTNSGQIPASFDSSTATGCPLDFDGIRVDDGGEGNIVGRILDTTVTGNLADGVEYDEVGPGDVRSQAVASSFENNGNTGAIVPGHPDPDDGFDIDEADGGSIDANFVRVRASGNFDEGIDLDEAGEGNVMLDGVQVTANANEDEGVKIDEADGGSVTLRLVNSEVSEDDSQDGVELTETGDGNLDARITRSTITNNDNFGIKATQEDAGTGTLVVVSSDLTGNNDGAIDPDGVTVTLVNTAT